MNTVYAIYDGSMVPHTTTDTELAEELSQAGFKVTAHQ